MKPFGRCKVIRVIPAIGPGWYEKEKPVLPRVYHKYYKDCKCVPEKHKKYTVYRLYHSQEENSVSGTMSVSIIDEETGVETSINSVGIDFYGDLKKV